MRFKPAWRLVAMMAVSVAMTVVLVGRLASIQLVEPDRYIEWGEEQRIRGQDLAAHRGRIVDRSGITLAVSHPQTTIWADPRVVEKPHATARALASVLDVDIEVIEQRLNGDGAFAYIARQLPDALADEAMALNLDGVYTYSEHARFNPSGDRLARSVIGRAGLDQEGISGLEQKLSDELIGTPGRVEAERSNDGSTIPGGFYDYLAPEPGATVVLTLDRSIQYEAERQLVRHTIDTGSEGAVAIVADPDNGEILAMASVVRTEDGHVVPSSSNMGATWVFEPGSVFKPVTISGLVDKGVVSASQWFDLPRSLVIYEHEFVDEHRVGDRLQLKHILANSSNIGTITAARIPASDFEREMQFDTMTSFGFGEPTSLDFPGESGGIIPPLDDWSGLSVPTMAIGQGIATTPIQLVDAYMTIANEGIRRDLSLVRSVNADGEEAEEPVEEDDAEGEQVIRPETADAVAGMLAEVVQADYGTGALAAIPGYAVAGKTGTAWQVREDGTYGADGARHYVTSFAGFAPVDDPELVVFVALDDPGSMPDGTEPSASKIAAPLFADITQYALRRQQVPPVDSQDSLRPLDEERVRSEPAPGLVLEPDERAETDPGVAAGPTGEGDGL